MVLFLFLFFLGWHLLPESRQLFYSRNSLCSVHVVWIPDCTYDSCLANQNIPFPWSRWLVQRWTYDPGQANECQPQDFCWSCGRRGAVSLLGLLHAELHLELLVDFSPWQKASLPDNKAKTEEVELRTGDWLMTLFKLDSAIQLPLALLVKWTPAQNFFFFFFCLGWFVVARIVTATQSWQSQASYQTLWTFHGDFISTPFAVHLGPCVRPFPAALRQTACLDCWLSPSSPSNMSDAPRPPLPPQYEPTPLGVFNPRFQFLIIQACCLKPCAHLWLKWGPRHDRPCSLIFTEPFLYARLCAKCVTCITSSSPLNNPIR